MAPSSTVAICRSRDKFIIHRLKNEAQVSANYIVGQPDPPRDLVTTALTHAYTAARTAACRMVQQHAYTRSLLEIPARRYRAMTCRPVYIFFLIE